MMSIDQEKAVKEVYRSFLSHDYQRQWIDVDDLLFDLDYLSDSETVLEAEIQLYKHGLGTLKCSEDHGESVCLVPILVDSVNAILELYVETKELHVKNRYILQNYLAISHKGIIFVDKQD